MSTDSIEVHEVARIAHEITRRAGYFQSDGPFWEKQYEDEKVRIVYGLIPNWEEPSESEFTYIAVFLKKKRDNDNDNELSFGLPTKSKKDETLVYFIKKPFEIPQVHRVGRWEIYLRSLLGEFNKRSKAAAKLDKLPVDDESLFPEFS